MLAIRIIKAENGYVLEYSQEGDEYSSFRIYQSGVAIGKFITKLIDGNSNNEPDA